MIGLILCCQTDECLVLLSNCAHQVLRTHSRMCHHRLQVLLRLFDLTTEIDHLQKSQMLYGNVITKIVKNYTEPREGVIIDNDVIVIFPLGRFY